MPPVMIAITAVLAALALVYLTVRSIRATRQKLNDPSNFVTEAEPVIKCRATVVDRNVVMEKSRPDLHVPVHRIQYLVTFEISDSPRTFEVDEESYDRYSVAQTGELLTQNNQVLDFIADAG